MSKRIGILTSGGDCAGLNAAIAGAVHRAVEGYGWTVIGIREGKLTLTPFDEMKRLMDAENHRPKEQWWRALAPIAQLLAVPGPQAT